jgi:2'-phosphotransferase
LDLKPILSAAEIPMAVHGTTLRAWESIREWSSPFRYAQPYICMLPGSEGLSKMNRNHIHLAQGVPGDMVISGELVSRIPVLVLDFDCER